MTKYMVVRAFTLHEIQDDVDGYLKLGWRLQGGVSATPNAYLQAMIFEAEEATDAQKAGAA